MKNRLYLVLFIVSIISCRESRTDEFANLIKKWEGKVMHLPNNSIFTIQGKDTISIIVGERNYKIISYVDSTGCTSCKLQLNKWKDFVAKVDSLTDKSTQFFFYFHPKNLQELKYIMCRDKFVYPVCIDEKDEFNKINKIPHNFLFQTFLIDDNNKIVLMGNPIYNPNIKDLYINVLLKNKQKNITQKVTTDISLDKFSIDFGEFTTISQQNKYFKIANIGNSPLVIYDVVASCGCIDIEYNKKPICPGDTILFKLSYKAEEKGSFHKTVTVYCNSPFSPVRIPLYGVVKY